MNQREEERIRLTILSIMAAGFAGALLMGVLVS